jgi:hypothetical protein
MTKNFSFRRLLLLIKKQAAENLRLYLLSSFALLLVLSLVFIFARYVGYPHYAEETIYITYIFGLIIAGAVFASFSFQQLSSKDKATYFLSFPASISEKLSSALFFNLVVFPITYSVIFYIVQSIYWSYIHTLHDQYVQISYINWEQPRGFMEVFPYFFYVFFAVQAFYILGSAYFTRFGFIKTTITGIIIVFLFIWYLNAVIRGNFPGFNPTLTITQFEPTGQRKIFELSDFTKDIIIYAFKLLWAPVFWLATYFRLKETEV